MSKIALVVEIDVVEGKMELFMKALMTRSVTETQLVTKFK
jgi:hypothetical protein